MENKQWNALLNESVAACDMTGVLEQADSWFNQGFDYLRACSALASSYAMPQTWLESADGVSQTMQRFAKDWARIYGLGPDTARDDALAAVSQEKKTFEAALKKIKTEKATLKRALTQKEKKIKAQRIEMDKHKNRLDQKDKEIESLQAKVQSQAERLILMEAAGKRVAKTDQRSKAGATVPPAGK